MQSKSLLICLLAGVAGLTCVFVLFANNEQPKEKKENLPQSFE